jgi:hypothetical protein
VSATDLTRRSTLDALCRSRIAPLATLCARAALGLLHARHSKLSPRLRIAPYSMLGVRRRSSDRSSARFLPLRAACGLLRICRLTLRDGLQIALYATTSRPRVVHGLLRAQHFKLRTGHRFLCVRRLAFCSVCGSLRSLHSAPCVARGLLRAQHFRALHLTVVLRPDTYHSAPYADYSACDAWLLSSACGYRRTPDLLTPVLVADCSVLNTYAPRWDLLINLSESSQVKMFRSI